MQLNVIKQYATKQLVNKQPAVQNSNKNISLAKKRIMNQFNRQQEKPSLDQLEKPSIGNAFREVSA